MSSTTSTAPPASYVRSLETFVERCEQLVDTGFAYLAVLLCHELFRFLYPVEPYAQLVHEDPVPFAEQHITRLLGMADAYTDVFTPYETVPAGVVPASGESILERTTSDLYSDLWLHFDEETLTRESKVLLENRLPADVLRDAVAGRSVIDIGCGSGRYSIALALVGAARVAAVDYQGKAFAPAEAWSASHGLPVTFREGNILELPFRDGEFEFAFCNGVLHHSASIERGLRELARVLAPGGRGFLYLYAAGGIFWETRRALRRVFRGIPLSYTQTVLSTIGMPSNRFVFCDTWYVPIETHTTTAELHELFDRVGLAYDKEIGRNAFDLDAAIARGVRGAEAMWGDGEHRYVVSKAG